MSQHDPSCQEEAVYWGDFEDQARAKAEDQAGAEAEAEAEAEQH